MPFAVFSLLLLVVTAASTTAPMSAPTADPTSSILPGTWTLFHRQPIQRELFAVTCTSTSLFLHGGNSLIVMNSNAEAPQSGLWKFDPDQAQWKRYIFAGEMTARYSHALAVFNESAFVVHGKWGNDILSNGYVFDPVQIAWLPLQFGHVQPQGRSGMSTITVLDGFYLFFGRASSSLLNDVWFFSKIDYTWKPVFRNNVTHGPLPRYCSCCALDQARNVVVCFGGKSATYPSTLNDVWMFNLTSFLWSPIEVRAANKPTPAHSSVCVVIGQTFSVLLGLTGDDGDTPLSSHNALNLSSGVWMMPERQLPFSSGSGCAIGNALYILGGKQLPTSASNALWRYDLTTLTASRIFGNHFLPPNFIYAAHARVKQRLYIIWGKTSDTVVSNLVWAFDLELLEWVFVDDYWQTGQQRSGRLGAVAVELGSMIAVFGGYRFDRANEKDYSNDLDFLDVTNEKARWFTQNYTSDNKGKVHIPPRRAFAAAARLKMSIYMYGGEGEDGEALGDLWLFNQITNQWENCTFKGGPTARRGMSMHRYLEPTMGNEFIMLVGGVAEAERWMLNQSGWTPLPIVPPVGLSKALFGRFDATTFYTGKVWLTCGGTSQNQDLQFYNQTMTCFIWDPKSGNITLMSEGSALPINVYGAASASYKNKFFTIGGGYIQQQATNAYSNIVQYFTVPPSSMCIDKVNRSCTFCSPGTTYDIGNLTEPCQPVPPGHFSQWPNGEAPEKCYSGSFLSDTGGTSPELCLPCPSGYYQPQPGMPSCKRCPNGMECPFHSKDFVTKNSTGNIDVTSADAVPPSFKHHSVPIDVYFIAGSVFVTAVIVIAILSILHHVAVRRKVNNYLSQEDEEYIQSKYQLMDHRDKGITCNQLLILLNDLGVTRLTVEETYLLMMEFDPVGNKLLHFPQVLVICVRFVEEKRLSFSQQNTTTLEPPPPARPVSWLIDLMAKFSFKDIDYFKRSHRTTNVGDNMVVVQNHFGGIMTVLFVVVVTIHVSLLFITFYYENIVETRSSIPSVVVPRGQYANIAVKVTTRGLADSEQCVVKNTGECFPGTKINAAGFIVGMNNVEASRCEFTPPYWCSAVWECKNCSCSLASRVDFVFNGFSWFSSLTIAEVTSTSGTLEDIPAATRQSIQAPDDKVFLGSPPTEFFVEATPTFSQGYVAAFSQDPIEKMGYHVRFLQNKVKSGNMVSNSEFPSVFLVPVSVYLRPVEDVLMIIRERKSVYIDLLSVIIGAVSGTAAMFCVLTGLIDRIQVRVKQASRDYGKVKSVDSCDDTKEDSLTTSLNTVTTIADEDSQYCDAILSESIRPMLEADLTLRQAKAIQQSIDFVTQNLTLHSPRARSRAVSSMFATPEMVLPTGLPTNPRARARSRFNSTMNF